MRWTLDVAPLNFVRCLRRRDLQRKGDFEQRVLLTPINDGFEIKTRAVMIKINFLPDGT